MPWPLFCLCSNGTATLPPCDVVFSLPRPGSLEELGTLRRSLWRATADATVFGEEYGKQRLDLCYFSLRFVWNPPDVIRLRSHPGTNAVHSV